MTHVPVIVVTGPSGTGKTVTCWEIREILRERKVAHALIDMDNIRWCYVPGSQDRFNRSLGARNLAALWANFRQAGADRLVLSGIVEHAEDIGLIEEAVPGADITVYRLHVAGPTLEDRMRERERGRGLARNLSRAMELAETMARNRIGDHLIDADRGLDEIAEEIVDLSGWLS
ncbi:AAA family ATPase [Streptomyces sp. NPDC006711]|uniref:AAA family ATPase n=1 Tax=Streptomyces sp. NPDC006711 TaxID=3364762 RepID=UPI00367C3A09